MNFRDVSCCASAGGAGKVRKFISCEGEGDRYALSGDRKYRLEGVLNFPIFDVDGKIR